MDDQSGQIRVNTDDYSLKYWVHIDDESQVAELATKSMSVNPSRYFATELLEFDDKFRDEQCLLQDPNKFRFTDFGDEIKTAPSMDRNTMLKFLYVLISFICCE